MKIGVYVGSFDPVHKGHLRIINQLLNKKVVNKILVIPTLNYWDKQIKTSLQDRIGMLKIYESKRVIVNDKYSQCQYTYEILRALKKESNDDYYLIIGSDSTTDFHKWKELDELLLNHIIIVKREGYEIKNQELLKGAIVVDNENANISSTMIRNNLKDNLKYLDQKIIDYILKHNLY